MSYFLNLCIIHILWWKCSCFLPVGYGWKQMAADRERGLEVSEWATDGKVHMPPSPLSLPAVPWLTVGRFWPHPGWGWIEDHGEEWSVLRIEMVIRHQFVARNLTLEWRSTVAMNQPVPQEHLFKTACEKSKRWSCFSFLLHFRKDKTQLPFLFEVKNHTGTFRALGEYIFFTEEEKCLVTEVLPVVCEDTVLQCNSIQLCWLEFLCWRVLYCNSEHANYFKGCKIVEHNSVKDKSQFCLSQSVFKNTNVFVKFAVVVIHGSYCSVLFLILY